MFTGDRSGDWLYRALHRAGFANQAEAIDRVDGLSVSDCYITAIVHCAPPDNKPTAEERATCAAWLDQELDLLASAEVVVTLGQLAYNQVLRRYGAAVPKPRPRFGHGREVSVDGGPLVIASYHPSQQNTFTGRLTEVDARCGVHPGQSGAGWLKTLLVCDTHPNILVGRETPDC